MMPQSFELDKETLINEYYLANMGLDGIDRSISFRDTFRKSVEGIRKEKDQTFGNLKILN